MSTQMECTNCFHNDATICLRCDEILGLEKYEVKLLLSILENEFLPHDERYHEMMDVIRRMRDFATGGEG